MTDIVAEAFLNQRVPVHYRIYPAKRVLQAMQRGEVCAAISGKQPNKNVATYSAVHTYSPSLRVFYMKDRFPSGLDFNDVEELERYSIGYILGGAFNKVLQEKRLFNVEFVRDNHLPFLW